MNLTLSPPRWQRPPTKDTGVCLCSGVQQPQLLTPLLRPLAIISIFKDDIFVLIHVNILNFLIWFKFTKSHLFLVCIHCSKLGVCVTFWSDEDKHKNKSWKLSKANFLKQTSKFESFSELETQAKMAFLPPPPLALVAKVAAKFRKLLGMRNAVKAPSSCSPIPCLKASLRC